MLITTPRIALLALAPLALSGCFGIGGELLPDQTLQPLEVTQFLGAVPPSVFVFHGINDQGFPEYGFEIDGSMMVGIPGDEEFAPMLVDKHEITNAQYRRFCEQTGRIQPRNRTNPAWRHYYFLPKPNHPIDHIAWYDANDYARWAGKALPSAEEWHRAATFGGTPAWVNGPEALFVANSAEVHRRGPDRVGSYPADVSPTGVMDMAANIDEWVDDSSYGFNRRVMGGYWGSARAELMELITVGTADDGHNPAHGFRTIFRLQRVTVPASAPPAAR